MNIQLQEVEESDFAFAFEAKKQAMAPYIIPRWGWDEEYQLTIHRQKWNEKPWFLILSSEKAIGTVSIENFEGHARFGEFYILDEFRNQGIGTTVLTNFLTTCDADNQKVVLEYLKWNPVGALYKRNGFEITHESETHYFMKREPQPIHQTLDVEIPAS